MTGAFGTVVAFLVSAAATEMLLSRGRSQSAAGALLAIHAAGALLWSAVCARAGTLTPLPILLFWGGAMLTWIGIRIHIESSILLRMTYLAWRAGEIERSELLARCEAQHGIRSRIDELARGGFVHEHAGQLEILPKGRLVVRLLALLARGEGG